MAESQGASADSKPCGADMTAGPLYAHPVATGGDTDPPIGGPLVKVDPVKAAAQGLEVDPVKAAALDENQAVNDDQALPDVNQNVLEGSEPLRRSAHLNPQGSPGRYAYTRASRWDILPFLDVGDAKYQSMLEENRLLRMRNEDLEEEILGLKEQVQIQAGVITGLTCCKH
ncbi:hypothetical protein KC19_1G232300 [Ceratodon purpureus]|uniref:Uncharacterized protein n=1 Tax=Ceratodon purpureus TaxID=3225 RepID=A0A8T0JB75_CERPU|nr:hypothetical protein KC19_1G232200 [Ceratodon purpureus]KAG0592189.1 hypothetical protein KC19_1G232300 [Ceratodon purpureus]